jgi:hypothetical protein
VLKIYGTVCAGGYVGDKNLKYWSYGPFQANMAPGAVGDWMLKQGVDPRNPATVPDQIRLMRKWGAQHGGWSSDVWYGLRDQHIGSLRAHPATLPPRNKGAETHVHNHIYMDGKVIARNTSKHFVRAAQYPTSVGRQDGRGTFMGPGAEVFA